MIALPPFEEVFELHGAAVLRFCASQAGPDRAEDVFQETMLSALRAYAELRDAAAIRSWLFSIAARKAIDSHRARARFPEPVDDVEQSAASIEPELGAGELWRDVRALPQKQREAVGFRYVGELSYREIGTVMGTSEEAARRNVFEGLSRLRERMTP